MDKKPLIIISLCAVVLLVLASLTNVVGYQSVKSTVSDSPLFTTRTRRATNQQQNILTSQYLGMGARNLFQFPVRDNQVESLTRALELISKIDDKAFARFTTFCIQRAKQYDTLIDMKPNAIIQTLYVLRTHPDIIDTFLHKNNQNSYSISPWYPGCFIEGLYYLLCGLLLIITFLLIAIFYPNFTVDCGSPT